MVVIKLCEVASVAGGVAEGEELSSSSKSGGIEEIEELALCGMSESEIATTVEQFEQGVTQRGAVNKSTTVRK